MRLKALLINLCLLSGCSSPSAWSLHSIASGDIAFDSTRLSFISAEAHSPLVFELIQSSDRIESFIFLNRFRFTKKELPVTLLIDNKTIEELLLVYEGAMRIKLSEAMTAELIQALQNGHEVIILVDGFKEVLSPNQFPIEFK